MVSFSTIPLWDDPDTVLRDGQLGLLCNQSAWHRERGEYLFETLYARGNLKRVFIPEHGLFGEFQDQIKLDGTGLYRDLGFRDCEFVSLYGSAESSLTIDPEKLAGLDALIIELQDVGVRYYTFLSTLRNLFFTLKTHNIPLPVWLLDRENPAGSSVEGTPLKAGYGSFIGIEGLPHRYGLTIGELAHYFYAEMGADFPLRVISWRAAAEPRLFPWTIAPSPNISGYFTAGFYSGQCLWEGTNVSEGRGTTRPFEVFGAPWMERLLDYNRRAGLPHWNVAEHPLADPGVFLRWHRFIPVFHKYQDQCCFGFQLIPREDASPRGGSPVPAYHALLHALRLIRFMAETCEDFSFRPGKYEAGNGKTAIELLAGDPVLLDYLRGRSPALTDIREYLREEEGRWIENVREYRFYGDAGFSPGNLYSAADRM
ncbi:MAG: DUF1343 domain-containing protein [Spirochaetaceae bacterium]|jgi:uncharacterized protein YbbC (DUF1343 family)|nr:DUF1343 domain-containing protein [Spirochaetaceae bacterium]